MVCDTATAMTPSTLETRIEGMGVEAVEDPVQYTLYCHQDPRFAAKFLLHDTEQAIRGGVRCYVASDSKTKLETLASSLQSSDKKVLLITSDNAAFAEQRAFLDHPDRYLSAHQPDAVLVSPCVQSGVSIEQDYFERCVGVYTNTVLPVVFQQMLHRVRAQCTFDVALPALTFGANQATENATALLLDF